MSDAIIVREIKKDGIEYYVSDDRKISGMSHSGLARFCGVARQTLTQLIDKIEASNPAGNSLSESLKPIAGKHLGVQANGYLIENNARIVQTQFCYDILDYYAHDSLSATANRISRASLKTFGSAGIHTFILMETGTFNVQTSKPDLHQIWASIESELKQLRILRQQDTNLDLHEEDKPGLKHINHEYQRRAEIIKTRHFSIYQWLKVKDISLNNSQFNTFTRRVASSYRTLNHKEPPKMTAKKFGKPNSGGMVNVFTPEDEPILDAALEYVKNL